MLELKEFITNANKLFTIPDICLSLNELVAQNHCTVENIATVVSHDPALCIRVLKLANSALYGRKAQVSSIDQAILIIGTDELCNIAVATAAALIFKGIGESRINLNDYWYHSVYTAVTAQQIHKRCFGKRQGSLFVAGLLHNIGLLVVLERLPYLSIDLCHYIGTNKRPASYQRNKLGFYFSDVSAGLLGYWNLPVSLIHVIGHQHKINKDQKDNESSLSLYAAIKIADAALSKQQPLELENIFSPQDASLLKLEQASFEQIIEFSEANIQSVIDIIQG